MVFLNITPRLLINTSKFIVRKNKLDNKCRFVEWKSHFFSSTGSTFQIQQTSKIQGTIRSISSNIATQDETKQSKSRGSYVSAFNQHVQMRQRQARCSVLIELGNKNDVYSAISTCEQFGDVRSAYSYDGESENVFLLIEFTKEDSAKELLSNCGCKNILDVFTTSSRIIQFDKKFEKNTPKTALSEEETVLQSLKSKRQTVSELIEYIYISERLSELDTRLRFFFCEFLKDAIKGLFPHGDALPFGSSVNGFGKQGCDLDIMIRLYPSQVIQDSEFHFLNKTCIGNGKDLQRRAIYALGTLFSTFLPGFYSVQKILNARVPIIKFTHKITGMDCDISVNNMSAILMSEILYFCGEIDSRVRPLLYAVKKWAKESNVTHSAPGVWITNFGLSLLVIFFLQNRPVPILPSLINVLQIVGEETAPNFGIEYMASISDLQVKASINTESLAMLLKEFLNFLGSHPFQNKHLSLLTGKATTLEESCFPMWLQYPVEEDKNVTKNVSHSDCFELCEKARLSSKFIASNMNVKCGAQSDFSRVLGIPDLLKKFTKKSYDINLNELLNERNRKNHSRNRQKRT